MSNNNYCACNSGESKYTVKLNQQGPAGKKGEQGDKGLPGFSPYISVVQSDDENYILRINNEANSYNTPNLFPKDQLVTWTNNIEAQVNQNTTDLSKINGNYVDLKTAQEISGRKQFTNEQTEFSTETTSDFYNDWGKIIVKTEYQSSQIRFNSSKRTDGYYNGAFIGFSYYNNKLYYKGNISSQGMSFNSTNELAVKGDLPTTATVNKLGTVKPDGTTVTINTDGVISAVGEVTKEEFNNLSSEVATINSNVNSNTTDITNLESDLNLLTMRTEVLERTSATREEVTNGLALKVNLTDYNNRVGSLESTVGEQAQTIATLQENNTQLLEIINNLKDRVTVLETMIDGGNV